MTGSSGASFPPQNALLVGRRAHGYRTLFVGRHGAGEGLPLLPMQLPPLCCGCGCGCWFCWR